MKTIVLAVSFALWSGVAMAHSPLKLTSPINGAVVATTPDMIDMAFGQGVRLSKVTMTHLDHPSVQLDLSKATGLAKDISVPVQKMGAGTYLFEWIGMGEDGHKVAGDFSFLVE